MHIQAHHPQTSPFVATPATSSAAARPGGSAAAAASSSSSSSSSSSTSTATITANDFLQLLVTELQNQDPTANTDPNEYVDQLVQVNSLQQQIQMNETMDGGPTLTGSSNGLLQELAQINAAVGGSSSAGTSGQIATGGVGASTTLSKAPAVVAGGNLSSAASGKMQAAAEKVANSLAPPPNQATGSRATQAFEQFAARLKATAQQK
jgi:flagellar basal-body rod modification protein FlgD